MMDEEFVLKGQWWLPETPENDVPGELQYRPNSGVMLELQGDLHAPKDDHFHPPIPQNAPLILGITMNGREISLWNCTQVKGNVSIGEYLGIPETAFRVRYAFIGIHFPDANAVKLREIAVRFTHLDNWFDQIPFAVEYPSITSGLKNSADVILSYKKADDQEAIVNGYMISFAASGPETRQPSMSEFVISQKAWVRIKSTTNERGLDDFLTIMRRIQDFLTLGVGEPVYPIENECYCEANKKTLKDGKEYYPPVQIVYNRPWEIKPPIPIHPLNMMFTLRSINDRLETHMNNWFAKAEELKPVLNLYFSILYKSHLYFEFKFLGLVQAIESYHRRVYGGKYLPDEKFLTEVYPKLVQAIPPNLDAGFKQSLKKGKLCYANEFSLRKRLQELTRHLGRYLPLRYLTISAERQSFVEKVCDTRNYLTHYDPDLSCRAITSGKESYELFKQLHAMLDALLLEVIGFEQKQVREMIRKNRKYTDLFCDQ